MNDTRHTVLLRDSQPRHISLPSRQSIKPSSPDYDRISFQHLKAKCLIQPSGCWEIQGVRHQSKGQKHAGYGDYSYRGRNMRAHRASYLMAKGPIPMGYVVAHACDNPPCVNPDHLFTCTESENIKDAAAKKRHFNGKQTHCAHGHEFTAENTRLTKVGGRPDLFRRQCLQCQRDRQKKPERLAWQRVYQRMRRGWTREEAMGIGPIKPGQRSARRSIGVTHVSDEHVSENNK